MTAVPAKIAYLEPFDTLSLENTGDLMALITAAFAGDGSHAVNLFRTLASPEIKTGIHLAYSGSDDDRVILGVCQIIRSRDHVDVGTVAVARNMRRKGIGRSLMQAVIRLVRDVPIRLTVATENRAAHALYTSLGFRVVNTYEHYYGAEAHAHRMELAQEAA